MAYGAQAAYRLDVDGRRSALERPQPVLSVVEGGGADARARQGVSSQFVSRTRAFIVVVAAFTLLGVARVSITTATVNALSDNAGLEESIATAEEQNSSLRVERAILSSSQRVDRIATQNLGMVPAEGHDVVSMPAPLSENAQDEDDAESDAPADETDEAADDPQANDTSSHS